MMGKNNLGVKFRSQKMSDLHSNWVQTSLDKSNLTKPKNSCKTTSLQETSWRTEIVFSQSTSKDFVNFLFIYSSVKISLQQSMTDFRRLKQIFALFLKKMRLK